MNNRFLKNSLLLIAFCTVSLLLSGISRASIVPPSIVQITTQDAGGAVTKHCNVGDVIEISSLDATADIFRNTSDYSTPNSKDKLVLNDLSSIGGWSIQPLTEAKTTKDGTLYSPTADVLSFSRWVVQYNSPDMLQPITAANRYNKWVTLFYVAKAPGLTTITASRGTPGLDCTSFVFRIQVDSVQTF